jgi:hypothetical protein
LDVALLLLEGDPADPPAISELGAESLAERSSVALDRLPGLRGDGFSPANEHPVVDVVDTHLLFGELFPALAHPRIADRVGSLIGSRSRLTMLSVATSQIGSAR